MTRTDHCPNCECDRPFAHEVRREPHTIRGETIELAVPQWICATCGESIVDAEYGDPIAHAMDAYRARHGLLSAVEIRHIRQSSGLSQVAFATLLGMSPATINRYELGALQQEKEDELIRTCARADIMRDLLRRRGSMLSARQRRGIDRALGARASTDDEARGADARAMPSEMSREMSHRNGFREFDYERYAAATIWLCTHIEVVSQTKLYKLLFYADFVSFRLTSRSLTGSLYRRMPYGPVPSGFSSLRSQLEEDEYITVHEVAFGNGNTGEVFRPGANADQLSDTLDDEDLRMLRIVRDALGTLTPSAISDRSHQETAWKSTAPRGVISYETAMDLSIADDGAT